MAITGKVALVLGPRELVINKGTRDGVWNGMKFAVLDLRASNVSDPDTDEILGSISMEKIRVQVVKAEARVALARTYERVYVPSGLGFSSNLQEILAGTAPRYKTFTSESATWDETKSIVKRGDTVEQIIEESPHRVIDVVQVYDSPALTKPVDGVKAILLEIGEGVNRSKAYYPTTHEYRPNIKVTWEWNTSKAFEPMWYIGTKGQALKAWDRSFEFVGKEIPAEP